jgi:segregation and condensation protein B
VDSLQGGNRDDADAAGVEVRRAIEAMLMVALDPVPPNLLAQLLEVPTEEVERVCRGLAATYVDEGRGFSLARVAGGFRFQSHPDQAAWVERFVLEGQSSRLTSAALETLAIVAYKQPVSRGQVSAIRGVDVDGVMRTLQHRGYIVELSRDPGPANAVLFGTTSFFLERLGLDSVHDLPPLGEFVPGAEVVEALERGLRVGVDLVDGTSDLDEPIEEPVDAGEPSVAEVLGADGPAEA